MARIPYFDPETASPAIREALDGRRQINVFKLIAQSEAAAAQVFHLGHALTRGGSLDPVLREVVILRVADLTGAAYMAHEHDVVARRVGLSEEKIQAVLDHEPGSEQPELTAFERTLIDFTDSVVRTTTAPDELFSTVADTLGHSKTVEVMLVIGFYLMIARVMNTFEIELETGPVPSFDFS